MKEVKGEGRPLRRVRSMLGKLWNRSREEADLDEEIRFHIEKETEENLRRGMKPRAARQAALRAFGGRMAAKEDCRASWGVRMVDDLLSDIAQGLRQMDKNKGHSFIIIVTLGLCLGANTAAFNFFEELVRDPYDYPNEERIVRFGKKWPKLGYENVEQISVPHFDYVKEHAEVFDHIGFVDDQVEYDLDLGGKIRRISADRITPEVWDITGVEPLLGSYFSEKEAGKMGGDVVVLSEWLWRELKTEDSDLIGEELVLDGRSYQVIGVAPESFYLGMSRVEAWLPRVFESWERDGGRRNNHSYVGLATLKPGVTVEQADDHMEGLFEAFLEVYPQDRDIHERTGATFGAEPVSRLIVNVLPQIEMSFQTIRLVTLIVLIIGCLNIGGMILVKGYARLQEFAMRRALGATVGRLSRQLYMEIFLYFLVGGFFSLVVLEGCFEAARLWGMNEIPWEGNCSIDGEILALTFVLVLFCAFLTGSMPLVSLFRRDLMKHLKSGGRTSSSSPSKHRMHAFFVISQVALSIILLVTSGVLVRNLAAVLGKDVGFEREQRVSLNVPLPAYRFGETLAERTEKVLPFQEGVLTALRALPGVKEVSATNRVPISVGDMGHSDFSMPHYSFEPGEAPPNALRVVIRPGYFKTVGTELLMGRDFEETDHLEGEKVVIIGEDIMHRYFEGVSPVGMTLHFWGQDLRIVGVAERVQDKPFFMETDHYTLYFPYMQWPTMSWNATVFVAHVEGKAEVRLLEMERRVLQLDPNLTMTAKTFEEDYKIAIFAQELPMLLTVCFGLIAVFLSGIGLYGLMSFAVIERTKEYGIRMALGAKRSMILERVMRTSGGLILWGMGVGLVCSFVLCWKINPVLPDIDTVQPVTFIAVILFILVISIVASLLPALRATRINVIDTLRYE